MRSDVCLILEGTYPYVAGGVSTWVAQILEHMPQLRFSIVYIGPQHDQPRSFKYPIPSNVVEIREVFVHDHPRLPEDFSMATSRDIDWDAIERFAQDTFKGGAVDIPGAARALESLDDPLEFMYTLARSPESWEGLLAHYKRNAPEGISFIDYFWVYRFINLPALNLLRTELPSARLYHTACTGYAGLLAAKAHHTTGAPVLLTEHGLYTRERRIEIYNAEWIQDSTTEAFMDLRRSQSFFKEWWTHFFLSLSRTAYEAAARIVTLFDANRRQQIRDGAPQERSGIIPNGIDTARFAEITPRTRQAGDPLRIGFVGRVTAIKDIKTLLRSLAVLKGRNVPFEALIMGPLDEEPDYAQECRDLAHALEIDDEVRFTGRVDVMDYFGKVDVVALTSISEAQPFAVIEANCAGLPVVVTDVGACRELVQGRAAEDKALGESGFLTPVASPEAIADAFAKLAESPELAHRMGQIGHQRALRFYDIHDVMNEYLMLYETFLYAGHRAQPEGRGTTHAR